MIVFLFNVDFLDSCFVVQHVCIHIDRKSNQPLICVYSSCSLTFVTNRFMQKLTMKKRFYRT